MSLTCRRSPVLTELVAELIEAHCDSIELLQSGGLGSDACWHVAYLQEQVLSARVHLVRAGGWDRRSGGGPLLDLAEELLESHLDTVELLVDLRTTDTDVRSHVAYLQSLELEGRAMVARESTSAW